MNKVIEFALTAMAVLFLLCLAICVLAASVAVFLELVKGFYAGMNKMINTINRLWKKI